MKLTDHYSDFRCCEIDHSAVRENRPHTAKVIYAAVIVVPILMGLLILAGCSTVEKMPEKSVTLVIPDNYLGDIFILAGDSGDQDWEHSAIHVSNAGIAYVSKMDQLSEIEPRQWAAKTTSGKSIASADTEYKHGQIMLWPEAKMTDKILYLIVGTYGTMLTATEQKRGHWPEIIAENNELIRQHLAAARKEPN